MDSLSMIGFANYAPPGIYTATQIMATLAPRGLKIGIPHIIGVGEEEFLVEDFEVIRGSSSNSDNYIPSEDISSQFDGTSRAFTLRHSPIVTGNGLGITTNDPKYVKIYVNDVSVPIYRLDGSTGEGELTIIPLSTDIVTSAYYYKNKDTKVSNEDISSQFDGTNTRIYVKNRPIVDGTNGGVSTTDPAKVSLTVDGKSLSVSDISAVNGEAGYVDLISAPLSTAKGNITYYTNTFQDGADELPYSNITEIVRVGLSPNESYYTKGQDFVLDGDSINWGVSYRVEDGDTILGNAFSKSMINVLTVDNMYWNEKVNSSSYPVDGVNKVFQLSFIPVDGTGKAKTTNDSAHLKVYVGSSISSAVSAGAVSISHIEGASKLVYLSEAPTGGNVYVSYYYNRIYDNKYIFTKTDVNEYSVVDQYGRKLYPISFDLAASAVHDVNFPTEPDWALVSQPDMRTTPGYSIVESITVLFTSPTAYTVTSDKATGTGSGLTKTGLLGQTFIDDTTGVSFTLGVPVSYAYTVGDSLVFRVGVSNQNYVVSSLKKQDIPGVKFDVSSISSVGLSNTLNVYTYKKEGAEPTIGSYYYVTLKYAKPDSFYGKPRVFYKVEDVYRSTGKLDINNTCSLGAYLSLLNGSPAVTITQLKKNSQGFAPSSSYISAMIESKVNYSPIYRSRIMVPMTTDEEVIDYMHAHVTEASAPRMKNERFGLFGFDIGYSPEKAMERAQGYLSKRMICYYPETIVRIETNDDYTLEYVVPGYGVAAAASGLFSSVDPATDITDRSLSGIVKIAKSLDETTMNNLASVGVSVLDMKGSLVVIRDSLSTDITNIYTRNPYITTTTDFVQEVARMWLRPYQIQKIVGSYYIDLRIAVGQMLSSLKTGLIISSYGNIRVYADPSDKESTWIIADYSPMWTSKRIKLLLRVGTMQVS